MVPTLFGISLLTFVLLDLIPSDRAAVAIGDPGTSQSSEQRELALFHMRVRYGLVDAETGEPFSVWLRYTRWVQHAALLDFAPKGEDPQRFRQRFLSAVSLSAFLGALAVSLAFLIGVPLGRYLGSRRNGPVDRGVSTLMLGAYGMPEFLLATLLMLVFSGGWLTMALPATGLHSVGSESMGGLARLWDFGLHLVLPITVMSLAPAVEVTRFVRESVARASGGNYVLAMRGWGMPEHYVCKRIAANGRASIATLVGALLPIVFTGSIVVENVFGLPGMGRLAFEAIREREPSAVMATTLSAAMVTLVGYTLSDVLHRVFDRRVELS